MSTQTPSCLTCRHAEPVHLDTLVIECRRYPPTILITTDGDTLMAYPQVTEGDWCAEYQPERNET